MKWNKERSYEEPVKFEEGKTTVYIRRNIMKKTDDKGTTYWEYDECKLSLDEYAEYKDLMNSMMMYIIGDRFDEIDEKLDKIINTINTNK